MSGPPQLFKDSTAPKKFACYTGVVPFDGAARAAESGPQTRETSGQSDCQQKLKALLHLAALPASRHSKEFQTYFDRKVSEGKNKMLPGRRAVLNNIPDKIVLRILPASDGARNMKIFILPLSYES